MALQMNYYHEPMGITFMNAYWRINPDNGIIGGKNILYYTIEVFKDADMAHVNEYKSINSYRHSFVPDVGVEAINFIKQAYVHAKTTEQFSGSVDV